MEVKPGQAIEDIGGVTVVLRAQRWARVLRGLSTATHNARMGSKAGGTRSQPGEQAACMVSGEEAGGPPEAHGAGFPAEEGEG